MQLRVVLDQPWEVPADVLAVPFIGGPEFEGPLGELDRRAGGELKALVAFGELGVKRYAATLSSAGELPVGRLLAVAVGAAEKVDREVIHRIGSTVERRLGGRTVKKLAIWLGDLPARIDGDGENSAAIVAEHLVRGVVEGSYEPQAIYRDKVETAPPALDELILIAPGADRAALERAADRGRIMGEGANTARTLANRASNDLNPIGMA